MTVCDFEGIEDRRMTRVILFLYRGRAFKYLFYIAIFTQRE